MSKSGDSTMAVGVEQVALTGAKGLHLSVDETLVGGSVCGLDRLWRENKILNPRGDLPSAEAATLMTRVGQNKSTAIEPMEKRRMAKVFVRNDVETVETTVTEEVNTLVLGNLSPVMERAVRALVASNDKIDNNAANGQRQNVSLRVSAHGSYSEVRGITAPVSKY